MYFFGRFGVLCRGSLADFGLVWWFPWNWVVIGAVTLFCGPVWIRLGLHKWRRTRRSTWRGT